MTMGHHLLLAETRHDSREALSILLRREGYRVTAAGHHAALRRALAEHPDVDLLILDAHFGCGRLAQLVADARRRSHTRLPVVVLTSNHSLLDLAEAYRGDVTFCLARPVNERLLRHALAYILKDLAPRKSAALELELLTAEGVYFG
ncbi:MAG: response regulator [Planctomycetota bacterium]|nr:response regulator [Planctomycetota bacterium]